MIETDSKSIKLHIIEEQQLFREVFKTIFNTRPLFELTGIGNERDLANLKETVLQFNPDVLLLSTKKLSLELLAELEQVRTQLPGIGLVLLLAIYGSEDTELLRELARKGEGGTALFLKQSLDEIDQLCGVVQAVYQGQIILDPLLAAFMFAAKPKHPFLSQLTARELEILSLLAQGYTNTAIAESLFIDIKTVEHHINGMYGKLKADADFTHRHPRVNAARLYLETTGELVPVAEAAAVAARSQMTRGF